MAYRRVQDRLHQRRRYHRGRDGRLHPRMSMSGVTSQPPGMPVARSALGATVIESPIAGPMTTTKPTTKPIPIPYPSSRFGASAMARAVGGIPDWRAAMQGTSLGTDDSGSLTSAQGTIKDPTLVEAGPTMRAWQDNMLAQQKSYQAYETKQRWIQVVATLSIPLAAAVWRAIFRGGRRSE
jgi:hypothetical protein